jgi:hypothetical protein
MEVEQDNIISMDRTVILMMDVLLAVDVGGLANVVAGPRVGIDDDGFVAGFSMGLAAGIAY